MKARYYFSMVSIIILPTLSNFLFFYLSGSMYDLVASTISDILAFIVLNLLGVYFFYKPIDAYIKGKIKDDNKVRNRVKSLPLMSALWIVPMFLVNILINTIGSELLPRWIPLQGEQSVQTATENPFFLFFLVYIIFLLGLYLYFFIANFSISLKRFLYNKFNVVFSPGKGKIWHKLIIVFLLTSIIPIALIMILAFPLGFWDTLSTIHQLIITAISGILIIIGISIFLITNGFRKPFKILLESFKEVKNGDYSQKTPIITNDEIGLLISNFNGMVDGLAEREFIRDTFGKYVTKSVADKILNQDITLTGDVRLTTILFSDIENYTATSEGMKPAEVVKLLNDYFTFTVEIISGHKGMVNKFIGDAVLAVFNAPVDDPDHAHNALKAALEIQELSKDKRFGNNLQVHTRIGINTGMVVAGNIGSKERLEYTVIGDEVNIASRLEQLNKEYNTRVLVGENTYRLTKDAFTFERIGDIKLKGKEKSVEVYKLLF